MSKILDGKVVRDHILQHLAKVARGLPIVPVVAIIQVGDKPESTAFIRQKTVHAEKVGIKVQYIQFESTISQDTLIAHISKLNKNRNVHGIIIQLPLPSYINKEQVIEAIDPNKDVDGLHSQNVKKLWVDDSSGILAATARGVRSLCRFYNISLKGKHVVMVGRSALVGEPVAHMCLNEGSTVTICHKATRHLALHTKRADILIVAAGVPSLISKRHVEKGQIVIDIGITSIEQKQGRGSFATVTKKLVGDVDFERVKDIVKAITPVPGGVGPLTVASLLENVVDAAHKMIK